MENRYSSGKAAPHAGTAAPSPRSGHITIGLPGKAAALLELLLDNGQLRLQAGMGDYLLEFPPDSATAGPAGHHLQLDYPAIIETTPGLRMHRILRPHDELQLVEDGNKLESARIRNISESGLGLICDNPVFALTPGKSVLTLRLRFPRERWAPCKARVVRLRRRPRQAILGLQFINPPSRTLRLLRAYVFQHTSPCPEFGGR
jgi:hypothetical protein